MTEARKAPVWMLLTGIILVGLNLRGSIVGVGPLLKDIAAATGLPASALGLLVTLPLLGFGLVSPVATAMARRFGIERLLLVSLLVLGLGTLVRSMPEEWTPFLPVHTALFAGTVLIGCSIAVGNVVVPSLIRRDLPERTGAMTSLFVATFAGVGAVSAAIAVPIERWIGWRGSLGIWAVPAFVGVLAWLPLARGRKGMSSARAEAVTAGAVNVWKVRLAWYVTAFMGLQSLCFYVLVAWLPSVLRESGHSAEKAGFLTFLFQLSCLVGSVVSPTLVGRVNDQRSYAVGSSALTMMGFLLLLAVPSWSGATVVAGIGCGSNLGIAIVLFSARSSNSHDTGALSGMAQSIGYLVAASGPVLIGLLRDATPDWTISLIVVASIAGVMGALGWLAGRPGVMQPADQKPEYQPRIS